VDRDFDTTALRESLFEGRLHRDYLAHVFRWGWATRYINDSKAKRVLEPGCGADAQLARTFVRLPGPNFRPEYYLGLDLNSIPFAKKMRPDTVFARKIQLREKFNFVERWRELSVEFGQSFDLAVSFEVIEHMTLEHGHEYLAGINALLPVGGTLILSTPVFNGSAAKNHVHEYTVGELDQLMLSCGFEHVDRFGTFASFNDIKRAVKESSDPVKLSMFEAYERARQFYGDEVLACFLAPLFPDHSRNNVWIRKKSTDIFR